MIENWIIPCNVKHFDIFEHFSTNKVVVWKNSFSIHNKDNVYIYISAPYSEIRFLCTAVSDEISEELLQQNSYAVDTKPTHNFYSKKTKYILLEKKYEYPSGLLTFNKLKEHGLGQVQIQARTDKQLQSYLDSVNFSVNKSYAIEYKGK